MSMNVAVVAIADVGKKNQKNKFFFLMNKNGYVSLVFILTFGNVFGQELSLVNKSTGWHQTNECFTDQIDITNSALPGFTSKLEVINEVPFNNWYMPANGMYLVCDLDGDGELNYFGSYVYSEWPSHKKDLFVHSRAGISNLDYSVFNSFGQIRKLTVTDFNNDSINEILITSHGYDAEPFPGDSIGIYHLEKDSIQYLSSFIDFFHASAVGDINNDNLADIVLGHSNLVYLNKGNFNFEPSTDLITNINSEVNWVTIEVIDLDNDNSLEIVTTSLVDVYNQTLEIIPKIGKVFDYENRISLPMNDVQVMDIDFLDLDNDGLLDIVINGLIDGPNGHTSYKGFVVKAFLNKGNLSFQETDEFINFTHQEEGAWYMWNFLYDFDKDGDIDIVPIGLPYQWEEEQEIFFSNNGANKFRPVSSKYAFTSIEHSNEPSSILIENYPNPFNSITNIRFFLSEPSPVKIEVYNTNGQIVRSYYKDQLLNGQHTLQFDGSFLSSGTYFYRLQTNTNLAQGIMSLIK